MCSLACRDAAIGQAAAENKRLAEQLRKAKKVKKIKMKKNNNNNNNKNDQSSKGKKNLGRDYYENKCVFSGCVLLSFFVCMLNKYHNHTHTHTHTHNFFF